MQIEGIDEKPKPTIEVLGIFKLKDKQGRNQIQIDLAKATRPLDEARYLYITKVSGQNNKIEISIHWKPSKKK